jgi:hypothetical protein
MKHRLFLYRIYGKGSYLAIDQGIEPAPSVLSGVAISPFPLPDEAAPLADAAPHFAIAEGLI